MTKAAHTSRLRDELHVCYRSADRKLAWKIVGLCDGNGIGIFDNVHDLADQVGQDSERVRGLLEKLINDWFVTVFQNERDQFEIRWESWP